MAKVRHGQARGRAAIALMVGALALAGCAEEQGWNPNYPVGRGTPYDNYREAREAALLGKGPVPRVIPRTLPLEAPTPAQIAGAPAVKVIPALLGGRPAVGQPTDGVEVVVVQPGQTPGVASVRALGHVSDEALIVYAEANRGAMGTRRYARVVGLDNCATYVDPVTAQRVFLSNGGPHQDPLGLDPDGDGFACAWSPVVVKR